MGARWRDERTEKRENVLILVCLRMNHYGDVNLLLIADRTDHENRISRGGSTKSSRPDDNSKGDFVMDTMEIPPPRLSPVCRFSSVA